MRVIAYLCLLVALAAAAYFLFWTGAELDRVLVFSGLGTLAGLVLIVSDRATRARLRPAAEIETATQQATASATRLAALEQEATRHRNASAEALVQVRKDAANIAKNAGEARQRADELVAAANEAKAAQARLGDLSDFNMLITRANSDDREAFDELTAVMARGQDDPRAAIAQRVVFSLLSDQRIYLPIPDDHWSRYGFDPDKASLAEYSKIIAATRPDLAAHAVLKLSTQERFTRRERFMMLANLIQNTKSIRVLEAACEALGDEARIRKNILAWRDYLTWWHANESLYQ
ncbi:MAG TPA: hypothetical protein VHN79_04565 [Lacunisphaera sp.]|nr:hypothetical protein [Lacunisphaera sp.]